MELVEVACARCGASIELEEGQTVVTCSYCDAKLRVKGSGDALETRAIEDLKEGQARIEARQGRIEDGLRAGELRDELEALEDEWEQTRERLCMRDKKGRLVEPKDVRKGGLVLVAFGIAFIIASQTFFKSLDEEHERFVDELAEPMADSPLERKPRLVERDESSFSSAWMVLAMGGLVIVGGVAMFVTGGRKAEAYQRASSAHEADVREVQRQLDEVNRKRGQKKKNRKKKRDA